MRPAGLFVKLANSTVANLFIIRPDAEIRQRVEDELVRVVAVGLLRVPARSVWLQLAIAADMRFRTLKIERQIHTQRTSERLAIPIFCGSGAHDHLPIVVFAIWIIDPGESAEVAGLRARLAVRDADGVKGE